MNVVGKVGSFITQGMYSVATPFHPFGGAVDIIVVKQNDGTFRSTPWYVRFGKFQGVLKGAEKLVKIEVNGVEANFHMHLDNSGEAYFVREVDPVKNDSDNLDKEDNSNSNDTINIHDASKENDFYRQDSNDFNISEVDVRDERVTLGMEHFERPDSDSERIFYEFQDEQSSVDGSIEFSEYGSSRYDNLDSVENALQSQNSNSEVVLVSVDGHILMAPISSSERNAENIQLSTPQFHLGPGKGTGEYNRGEASWSSDYLSDLDDASALEVTNANAGKANNGTMFAERELCIQSSPENASTSLNKKDVFKSCLELSEFAVQTNVDHKNMKIVEATDDLQENSSEIPLINEETEEVNNEISRNDDVSALPELQVEVERTESGLEAPASEDECSNSQHLEASIEDMKSDLITGLEISLCGNLLYNRMGLSAAEDAFDTYRVTLEDFKHSASSIVKNENLIVRVHGKYLPWDKAMHIVLGKAVFDLDLEIDQNDVINVERETPEVKEDDSEMISTPSRRWRLWPIPFRRVKTLEHSDSNLSNEDVFVDSESVVSQNQPIVTTPKAQASESPRKQIIRTNVPTTDQIASLNLKEGQNMVNFVFSTRVLGSQKVEAHIYLWKWNTRIVISDVDGTITKSDVLGQFMPLVGKDWTHSGIARLFSAIKENGYQLLFLSARAIVQAYLTKSFLFNLKQDGKSLPNGPVVISPDGLFPSLYREVIRRAPHEFKIACLEDIKALFPPDYNPFYAGFGNRDTDELSYRKIGIPKGKIFIINPKGEVAINHRIDVKSYTSLHTLVNDMFPPTSLVEQEDYNSWNYWKMPLVDIDNL